MFPVVLPSGERYWTVLDEQLAVVEVADAFLRHVRFGRDHAELTTKAYASSVVLFLRWCGRTGRDWRDAAGDLSLFITWLRFAPRELTVAEAPAPGTALVLAGPGAEPVRSPARIASVLVGVRAFLCHAVKTGAAPPDLLPLLYEIGDIRDLPLEARGSGRPMACRLKAQHRVSVPRTRRDRAADEEVSRSCGRAGVRVTGSSWCCWPVPG